MVNTNFSETVEISVQFKEYNGKDVVNKYIVIPHWLSFTVVDNYTGVYKEATINFGHPEVIKMFETVSSGSRIIIKVLPNEITTLKHIDASRSEKTLNNNTTIFIGYIISKTKSLSMSGSSLVVKCKDFMYKLETSTIAKAVKFTDKDTVDTLFNKLVTPVLGAVGESDVYTNISEAVRGELLFDSNLITKKVTLKQKNINIANYQPKIGTSVYDSFNKILHLHNLHMTSFFKDNYAYLRIAPPASLELVAKDTPENAKNPKDSPIERFRYFKIKDIYSSITKIINIEKQIPVLIAIASSNTNADVKGSNLKAVMLNELTAYNASLPSITSDFFIKDNINELLKSPEYNFKNPKDAVVATDPVLIAYQDQFEDDKRVSIFNVGNAHNQAYLNHYVLMSMRERQQESIKVNVVIPGFGCIFDNTYAIPASDCFLYIFDYQEYFYIKSVTYNCSMSGATTTLECILPNTMQFAKV